MGRSVLRPRTTNARSWMQARFGLRFWGPGDLGVALVGEVGDVAGAGGGDSCFYGGVGFFTRADAVEEIFHVVVGAVAEALGFDDGIEIAGEAFAPDGETVAGDIQGGFSAAEFEAAVVDG